LTQESRIKVVAGLIRRADGKILICLRPKHLDQGGLWEFPGGKWEAGESRFDALRRELDEELGIDIRRARPLLRLVHAYPAKTVELDVWEVSQWDRSPSGCEGQKIQWVMPSNLHRYEFPAANKTIISAARLPRFICAMPPLADIEPLFVDQLEAWLSVGARGFLIRKQCFADNLGKGMLTQIGILLGRAGAVLVVDCTPSEAAASVCALDDSLIENFNCDVLPSRVCHTPVELAEQARVGAQLVLIGPVCAASAEPENSFIEWPDVRRLVAETAIPAFAFGGIQPCDVSRAITKGCHGIILGCDTWSVDPMVTMNSLARASAEVEITVSSPG
jgi:8-oxo-dGTP diphosphatase